MTTMISRMKIVRMKTDREKDRVRSYRVIQKAKEKNNKDKKMGI
jgi:hypothetical protein